MYGSSCDTRVAPVSDMFAHLDVASAGIGKLPAYLSHRVGLSCDLLDGLLLPVVAFGTTLARYDARSKAVGISLVCATLRARIVLARARITASPTAVVTKWPITRTLALHSLLDPTRTVPAEHQPRRR